LTYNENLPQTTRVAKHPIHPWLTPFPIACFVGALVTDIAYWWTAEVMWADFSAWLLVVSMVTGVLAVIAIVIDFLTNRLIRARGSAWLILGSVVVLLVALLDTLVHTRDAWTSVVPTGLILSAIVVLILPFTGWLGWSMVYRYGVGASR
jgi:uncharacterized membrane protein